MQTQALLKITAQWGEANTQTLGKIMNTRSELMTMRLPEKSLLE